MVARLLINFWKFWWELFLLQDYTITSVSQILVSFISNLVIMFMGLLTSGVTNFKFWGSNRPQMGGTWNISFSRDGGSKHCKMGGQCPPPPPQPPPQLHHCYWQQKYKAKSNWSKFWWRQWVSTSKLLNQLGVTAPIESLHNLIETHKSDKPE